MEARQRVLTPELQKVLDTITGREKIYHKKCPLCRTKYFTKNRLQEFNTENCRVKYWQLKKELGEKELTERLNYLEENGDLPPKLLGTQ